MATVITGADIGASAAAATNAIKDIEGIDNIFVLGGSSPTGDMDIRRASITVWRPGWLPL